MKYTLLLFILAVCIETQAQERMALTDLVGTWQGTGQLFGQEAKYTMTWEEALDGQYIKLTFKNEIISNGQGIKSEAYYRPSAEHEVIGKWFDNRGYFVEIEGKLSENALTSHWANEYEQGKTVYALINTDSVSVRDFVWKENEYQQFGEARYTRAKD